MDAQHWQDRLDALAEKHGVVGASLAIGVGDDDFAAATGVLSTRTGQPVSPDSVFQIGSITKTWTATLVMQLVDDGLLDLDVPVVEHLPELRVADADATRRVTPRHLLTHTSGIDGDFFADTGRGDDALERYVAEMADLGLTTPLGAVASYCNSGFVVLGRLVEVLRGASWDAVLRERLFAPLGLESAGTLPEEALLWGAAVGHLVLPDVPAPVVAPAWGLPRSVAPAGLIHARARDLVTYARMHLADGVAADGTRVLSAASARAMREQQVEQPDRWTMGAGWGLSWVVMDWDGVRLFGHDGATIGQNAFLRALPATAGGPAVVVAVTANGGDMRELADDLFAEAFADLAGVTAPPRLEPPAVAPVLDAGRYVGRYARAGMEYEVRRAGDGLELVLRPSGPAAAAMGGDEHLSPMLPFAEHAFLVRIPGVSGYFAAVISALPDGTPFVHLGGRATPLVG